MRPTVSVIVPCFNAEKTVVRTLDSLVKQTLDNLEIIVINDGSTDHTKAIIENYITDHKEINICLYTKENDYLIMVPAFSKNFLNVCSKF